MCEKWAQGPCGYGCHDVRSWFLFCKSRKGTLGGTLSVKPSVLKPYSNLPELKAALLVDPTYVGTSDFSRTIGCLGFFQCVPPTRVAKYVIEAERPMSRLTSPAPTANRWHPSGTRSHAHLLVCRDPDRVETRAVSS